MAEYYKSCLDRDLQAVYNKIYMSLRNGNSSFDITAYVNQNHFKDVSRDINAVYAFVLDDHPEIYWVDTTKQAEIAMSSDGNTVKANVRVQFINCNRNANIRTYVAKGNTQRDLAYSLLEQMIKNVSYDARSPYQSLYGAAFKGIALCAGYARYYQYLLRLNGIDAIVRQGVAQTVDGGSERHAWLHVMLDGKKVLIDPTWCDPMINGVQQQHVVCMQYFAIPISTPVYKEDTFNSQYEQGLVNRSGWYTAQERMAPEIPKVEVPRQPAQPRKQPVPQTVPSKPVKPLQPVPRQNPTQPVPKQSPVQPFNNHTHDKQNKTGVPLKWVFIAVAVLFVLRYTIAFIPVVFNFVSANIKVILVIAVILFILFILGKKK